MPGSNAPFHQAHVQLHLVGLLWRVGQGKRTGTFDTWQLQVHVLPGLEGHRPVELEVHATNGR